MERRDVLMVMAVLRGAYPQYYRGISDEEAEDTVNLWTDLFADDDPGLVGAAVRAIIVADDREFPPLIGTIKEKMRQLSQPRELTEGEAWALIAKAVRNGLYGAQEEYAKLPPTLQKLVGGPSQLRDWAVMDTDTVHSVVASNLQRAYRTALKREQEAAKLPEDIRRFLAGTAEKMALEDGQDRQNDSGGTA